MCFSLCFRVGFSCSFPLRVHLFSLSLLIMFVKVVRLIVIVDLFWLVISGCRCWCDSRGIRVVIISPRLLFDFNCVWFSSVICNWFDWESGYWLWFVISVSGWFADWVELNCYWRFLVWVGWVFGYHVVVLPWVGMVGGDLFLID